MFLKALNNRAPETRKQYIEYVNEFKNWQKASSYEDLLIGGVLKEIEEKLINYITHLSNLKLSYSKMNLAISAMQRFYLANRLVINTKYIRLFTPKYERSSENGSQPYTKDQVERVLQKAKPREKLAILLMATAGPRIGALPLIKVKHLTFIEAKQLYAIKLYAGSQDEYWTFTTPQTSKLIMAAIKDAKPDRYLLKNHFYKDENEPTTKAALETTIWHLLISCSIRKNGHDTLQRKNVQLLHGFRKFFRTQLTIAGVHQENAEYLLGHIGYLVKTYSKPEPKELYDRIEYDKAIPYLTFDKLPKNE